MPSVSVMTPAEEAEYRHLEAVIADLQENNRRINADLGRAEQERDEALLRISERESLPVEEDNQMLAKVIRDLLADKKAMLAYVERMENERDNARMLVFKIGRHVAGWRIAPFTEIHEWVAELRREVEEEKPLRLTGSLR